VKDNSVKFWSTAAEDLREFAKEKEQPVNPAETVTGVDLFDAEEEEAAVGGIVEHQSPSAFSESIYDDDEQRVETVSSHLSESAELFEETVPGAFSSSSSDRNEDHGSFDTRFDLETNIFHESLRERSRVAREDEDERMLAQQRFTPMSEIRGLSDENQRSWAAMMWCRIKALCGCVDK
jgi:hypothetical protein